MLTRTFKSVLVTGASRGLGLELCRLLLLQGGFHVLACTRTSLPPAAASSLAAALASTRALPSKRFAELTVLDGADVASAGARAGLGGRAAGALREAKLDVLVNCAGVYPAGWDAAAFGAAMDTNARGALRLARELVPAFADAAHVINVSSGLGALRLQSADYAALLAACKTCVANSAARRAARATRG